MDLATAWSGERQVNGKLRLLLNSWLVYSRNAWRFTRGKRRRCLFVHESNETRIVFHVNDPLTCAKTLDIGQIPDSHGKVGGYQERRGTQSLHTCGELGIRIVFKNPDAEDLL